MGHDPLPGSLHDAIRAMEESELVAEILGEQVFENFLRNKRDEWHDVPPEREPVRAAAATSASSSGQAMSLTRRLHRAAGLRGPGPGQAVPGVPGIRGPRRGGAGGGLRRRRRPRPGRCCRWCGSLERAPQRLDLVGDRGRSPAAVPAAGRLRGAGRLPDPPPGAGCPCWNGRARRAGPRPRRRAARGDARRRRRRRNGRPPPWPPSAARTPTAAARRLPRPAGGPGPARPVLRGPAALHAAWSAANSRTSPRRPRSRPRWPWPALEAAERFGAEAVAAVRLAVIGMGKCGAGELNYISDVDVIYVHESDGLEEDSACRIAAALATGIARALATHAAGAGPVGGGREPAPRGQGRGARRGRWSPTSPTTGAGPRAGSSRPCSRPAASPAT